MTTFQEAQTLLELSQDYNSRLVVIIFMLLAHLFIFFFVDRFEREFNWQRARNMLLKIYSFVFMVLSGIFMPLYLSPGATLDLLFNYILDAYYLAMLISGILVIIWFYDMIIYSLSTFIKKVNPRRNYIFSRSRRSRK